MNPAWKRVIYHANRQRKPEKQNQKEDRQNETIPERRNDRDHLARVVLILARMVRPNEFISCIIEYNTDHFTAVDQGTNLENLVIII